MKRRFLCLCLLVMTLLSGCEKIAPLTEEAYFSAEEVSVGKHGFLGEPVFRAEDIPADIKEKMWGVTIGEDSPTGFDGLSYLTITYKNYDGDTCLGNMVVDKTLAEEVLCIFRELYEENFPIYSMKLMWEYGGSDEASMEDNNTSAFNDRPITGGSSPSYHRLGRAIDINPLVNPYVKNDTVLPENGSEYLDRTAETTGMITADSKCVEIFKKYGWTWGGDWRSLKDYQHFEKR